MPAQKAILANIANTYSEDSSSSSFQKDGRIRYIQKSATVNVVDSPCMLEVKVRLSFGNLVIPLLKTP